MTITFPLSPPAAPGFRGVRLAGSASVGHSRSPFTLESQVYAHQGQIWRGELQLPTMQRAEAEAWIAFLLSLNGRQGTFLMGIAGAETPRGAIGGTPLVNGGSQSGQTLVLDGASNTITGWLMAGDYVQLGSGLDTHLHKVLVDADSDGSGNVTLDIWPRLRASPADDSAVVVSSALGLWRLDTNDIPWDLSPPVLYDLSFPVVEAI